MSFLKNLLTGRLIAVAGIFLLAGPAPGIPCAGQPAQDMEALVQELIAPHETDTGKLHALFAWVAQHIGYDLRQYRKLERSGEPKAQRNPMQRPGRVFESRMAVCEGYANLLQRFCVLAGLRAEVIEGEGRPDSHTTYAHGWNAVMAGGQWHLVDATWAAGHVDITRNRFVPEYSETFFLMPPEEFIRFHYPADPMWQLLENPVTKNQFDARRFSSLREGEFHHADTIAMHFASDSLDRQIASLRRTLQFDPGNALARKNLNALLDYTENLKMAGANRLADAAVKQYNELVTLINDARKKNDPRLLNGRESQLLDDIASCRINLEQAVAKYKTFRFSEGANEQIRQQNLLHMNGNLKALADLEKFLGKYFSTPVAKRNELL